MSNDELIARQAKEIAELQDENAVIRLRMDKIRMVLVCVGGPLNDNFLEFTHRQLAPFFRIEEILDGAE